jgi:multiple sugar transport system permease protein
MMQIDRLSLLQKIGVYLATFVFLLFILLPFIEMIRVSLRPMSHLMTAEFSWWSEDFSLQAYRDMWTTVPLLGATSSTRSSSQAR